MFYILSVLALTYSLHYPKARKPPPPSSRKDGESSLAAPMTHVSGFGPVRIFRIGEVCDFPVRMLSAEVFELIAKLNVPVDYEEPVEVVK
jgi:hypothetical protein